MSKINSTAQPIMVDIKTAALMLSMAKSTIEKEIREGRFPKPRKIAQRSARYLVTELVQYAESRPVSDILPPPNCGRTG